MTGVIANLPKFQFFDNNGHKASGYKLYTYLAGTTTPATTWQDQDLTSANTNPIVLDSRGECDLWLDSAKEYKFVLKTPAGASVWTQDDVSGAIPAADFVGNISRVVDTIAALKDLDKTQNTRAFVLGYYSKGDGGGGAYFYDASDATSTDNGGTIIVASDGGRWKLRVEGYVTPKQFGAKGDGVADDYTPCQAAHDFAAGMFNQVAFPPAGAYYNPPIVIYNPGAYRTTQALKVYPGLTIRGQAGTPYTVEHTRIILDTLGGTVNQNTHIFQMTRTFQGVQRANNVTCTIEDLGFWITNPGSTIAARGGTAWTVDANGIGNGGSGCAIYCNEPAIDVRIRRCNFYTVPNAAVYFDTCNPGNAEIYECEFDTSTISVRARNAVLNLKMRGNLHFSGSYHFHADNCTGEVAMFGNEYQQNSRIKVFNGSALSTFAFVGNKHDGSGSALNALEVNKAKRVNITGNTFGLSSGSTIFVTDADGGAISGNVIVDSGYNATVSAGATDPGAIRLVGCQFVTVADNSIVTPDAATYSGFGIVCHTNGGRTTKCIISGNSISPSYTGAAYRSQSRRLNVETTDTLLNNETQVSGDHVIELTTAGGTRYIPRTVVSATGNVDIPIDPLTECVAALSFSAVSSNANFAFDIQVIKSPFTGAYAIVDVAKNHVAASGAGAHTISAGNTVTFSISGTNLRMSFSITTDSVTYAGVVAGAR